MSCHDGSRKKWLVLGGFRIDVEEWDCTKTYRVYIVHCRICRLVYLKNVLYVGETKTKISRRMNHHRNDGGGVNEHFATEHPGHGLYQNIDIYIVSDAIINKQRREVFEQQVRRDMRRYGGEVILLINKNSL